MVAMALSYDVSVVAFEQHGEAREILELNILLLLHHGVET
jgi:hypothetical protein